MPKLIKWVDAGPVKENILEIDPTGGLYVLEGPCGSGKSVLLEALDDALNPERKSTIPVRDGAPRAEVDVFGEVTIRRAKKSSRTGSLEVETLAGKFSVSELVDPGIDKPESADAARIKALLQITKGIKADPALFYSLVGGQEQFDKLVPSDRLATTDLVTLSARIKDSFEKASRDAKEEATRKYTQAEAARLAAEGIDVNAPCDEKILKDEYDAANREEARLQQAKKSYTEAETNKTKATEALQEAQSGPAHLPVDIASSNFEGKVTEVNRINNIITELEERLEEEKRKLTHAEHGRDLAEKTLEASKAHYQNIETLKRLGESQLPEIVLDIDLQSAASRVVTAYHAVEQGGVVRKAKDSLKLAAERKSDANKLEAEANALRDAAKATDNVLADAVKSLGLPLSVANSRLIITNSDRTPTGEELFSDLSKGERVAIVTSIAIEAVKQPGRPGMFILPQEFFEGLDNSHVLEIARRLEGSGVVAITAKAVDGDKITAKMIEPFPLGG